MTIPPVVEAVPNIDARLATLMRLRAAVLISDEDYAAQRARILADP